MTNTLITIVGATAIGKTALSIKLAQYFGCDIISCDSRQFYKEMSIGTAVPDDNELRAAIHHFIQNRSIFEDYNVGEFEKDALAKLEELFKKSPIQIMVGGSGLYVDAVLKGLNYFPDIHPEVRKNIVKKLETEGIESLQKQLATLDIETFNTIAIENPHRLIRALEICIGSGKTYSSFKNQQKATRNFNSIKIGLKADREVMYDRINKRVDIMMENGFLKEAKSLLPYKELNALQTVGYREFFNYFEGQYTLDFALEEMKKNTRRFAKRQGTWFRKDKTIIWFDFQEDVEKIIEVISSKLQ